VRRIPRPRLRVCISLIIFILCHAFRSDDRPGRDVDTAGTKAPGSIVAFDSSEGCRPIIPAVAFGVLLYEYFYPLLLILTRVCTLDRFSWQLYRYERQLRRSWWHIPLNLPKLPRNSITY